MQLLRKNLDQLIFVSLLAAIFISRIINLTIIPIFGDEAIYISWSQSITEQLTQLFIPLSDGKQPLFMWFAAVISYLIKDPLAAGRSVSIIAGLFSAAGIYFVLQKFFTKKVGMIGMLVYALAPIFFMYDRLAVPDNLLATFGIWSMYFGLRLIENPSLKHGILLGAIIGGGLLTKSPAIFFLLLQPFLLLTNVYRLKDKVYLKSLGFSFVTAAGLALIIENSMRVSKLYYVIGERKDDFVFPVSRLLTKPFDPFIPRIPEVSAWIFGYLTISIVGLAVAALVIGIIKREYRLGIFLAWFFLPVVAEMVLAKGFTPRYFLFALPSVVMLASIGVYWLSQYLARLHRFLPLILVIAILPPAQFIFTLVTKPENAPIPTKERQGYLVDWSAGYGIKEIAQYIKQLPQDRKILVGTEGHFGSLPDGLIVYTRKTPNIKVEGMGQPSELRIIPEALMAWKQQNPSGHAFIVVNTSRLLIPEEQQQNLELVASYPHPTGQGPQEVLHFFELR